MLKEALQNHYRSSSIEVQLSFIVFLWFYPLYLLKCWTLPRFFICRAAEKSYQGKNNFLLTKKVHKFDRLLLILLFTNSFNFKKKNMNYLFNNINMYWTRPVAARNRALIQIASTIRIFINSVLSNRWKKNNINNKMTKHARIHSSFGGS